MDYAVRKASLSCADAKASPRAFITNGRRNSSRLANVDLPVMMSRILL